MKLQESSRWAIVLIAAILLFVALEWAEPIAAPLVLGLVTAVILAPFSDFLDRQGLPRVLTALLGLAVSFVAMTLVILMLQPVVLRALESAPLIVAELTEALEALRRRFIGISAVTDAAIGGEGEASDAVPVPTLAEALTFAPGFVAQVLIFAGTVFFFLLSREEIYEAAATSSHERLTVPLLRWAEARVSRYFLTITVINFVFGGCVALVLSVIGMPQAMLWGGFAILMNFILYLGPAIVVLCLVAGGAFVFDGLAIFIPAAAFVCLNVIEGQFVTPALIGRQMSLNPLLVFLSLVFWLWLWGPVGGMVAIPLMLWCFTVGAHLLGDTSAYDAETAEDPI